MFEKLTKLAREPLVHFLFFGIVAYAIYDATIDYGEADDERTLTITASEIEALSDQWMKAWKRPPTEEEFAGLIRAHVRGKILYREALALGLDVGDAVIERRLAQKIEMLSQSVNIPAEPSEQDLKDWYDANPDALRQPDQYSILQVFFDPETRGAGAREDAEEALEKLREFDEVPPNFATYGDRSVLQSYYPGYSEPELRRQFGSKFVDSFVGVPFREWQGPIMSEYGLHLVWIDQIAQVPPPTFEEARAQIEQQWLAERIAENSERYLEELIARYVIIVEDRPGSSLTSGAGATP